MGKKSPPPPATGGFGALADALRARGLSATPEPERPPEPEPEPAHAHAHAPAAGKVVVRKETKGRAGKTVTTVQRLPLRGAALESWVVRLRQRLGTGATIDGDTVVVQGDQVARIQALLAEDGT